MSQHRKHRGYKTERIVAEYLSRYWKNATVGRGQGKDIQSVPFDCEVKAVAKLNIPATLRQIQARTAKSGELGFAVFRHNGMGEASVGDYSCVMRLEDLVGLLVRAGYTDMQSDMEQLDPMRCKMCGAWSFKETCNMCESNPDANL